MSVVPLPPEETITLKVSQIKSSPPTNENEFENAFEGNFDILQRKRFFHFRQKLPRGYDYYGFDAQKEKVYYLKQPCSMFDKKPACKAHPYYVNSFGFSNIYLPKLIELNLKTHGELSFNGVDILTQSQLPDPNGIYGYTIYQVKYKIDPHLSSKELAILLDPSGVLKTYSKETYGNRYMRKNFDQLKHSERLSLEQLRLLKPKPNNDENDEDSYNSNVGGRSRLRRRKNRTKKRRKSTKRRRK